MTARTPFIVSLACLLPFLGGCGESSRWSVDDGEIDQLIVHCRYDEAMVLARERLDESPDDPSMLEVYRLAYVASLLEKGRRATFADDDLVALGIFERALEFAPQSPQAAVWLAKTHGKLAERWLEHALEKHALSDLVAAEFGYGMALEHCPGHAGALRGLMEVTIQINYRKTRASDYYADGVRLFRDYWLDPAHRSFATTIKYEGKHARATRRLGEVERQLAAQRVFVAHGLEERGFYSAARGEYRLAVEIDPDNEEAAEGRARAGNEAQAAEMMRKAEMYVLKGEFEKAREQSAAGRAITVVQGEYLDGLDQRIDEAVTDVAYMRALSLEKDYRYPEAIEAYGAVLEEQDYFKDARARKQTLEAYVRDSARYYDLGEAETDPVVQLQHFRAAADTWPEYRDVQDKIKALEARAEL